MAELIPVDERRFTDPITGSPVVLTLDPLGVDHSSGAACPLLADVLIGLDAFYCPGCGWNGRVSGRWVHNLLIEQERVASR